MYQAYKLLTDLETKAKEDRLASSHEKALQEHFIRTAPLGTDRLQREYWSFVGDERLFVCTRVELPAGEVDVLAPPSTGPYADPLLARMFNCRPNRYRYEWSAYCG